MIRFLIWDVDGTVLDTYPAITKAMRTALHDLGGEAPAEYILGLTKVSVGHCLTVLSEQFGLDLDELTERYRQRYAEIPASEQPPFPGVRELCEYVRSIGGDNFIVTHRGNRSLTRLLTTHDLEHCFADRATREDNFPRKPDPAAFEHILTRNNLPRAEVLAIGDREIDVLAAQAASLRTCLYGALEADTIADIVLSDYHQLLSLIVAENRVKE